MIDLNAAMDRLEDDGRVRLYHAPNADFWTCGVFPEDFGSTALYHGEADTAEDAIKACLAARVTYVGGRRLMKAIDDLIRVL